MLHCMNRCVSTFVCNVKREQIPGSLHHVASSVSRKGVLCSFFSWTFPMRVLCGLTSHTWDRQALLVYCSLLLGNSSCVPPCLRLPFSLLPRLVLCPWMLSRLLLSHCLAGSALLGGVRLGAARALPGGLCSVTNPPSHYLMLEYINVFSLSPPSRIHGREEEGSSSKTLDRSKLNSFGDFIWLHLALSPAESQACPQRGWRSAAIMPE